MLICSYEAWVQLMVEVQGWLLRIQSLWLQSIQQQTSETNIWKLPSQQHSSTDNPQLYQCSYMGHWFCSTWSKCHLATRPLPMWHTQTAGRMTCYPWFPIVELFGGTLKWLLSLRPDDEASAFGTDGQLWPSSPADIPADILGWLCFYSSVTASTLTLQYTNGRGESR